jgi:hypothetical protein
MARACPGSGGRGGEHSDADCGEPAGADEGGGVLLEHAGLGEGGDQAGRPACPSGYGARRGANARG